MRGCRHIFDYYDDDPQHKCVKCGIPQSEVLPDCPCCGYPHCGHNHDEEGEGQSLKVPEIPKEK